MSSAIWYRVIDQLNPLCGCDVMIEDEGDDGFCVVTALRRFDVLMGDRPFQLRVSDGQNLGISVYAEHLLKSHIQDDVVEIGYDYPNGKCLTEWGEVNTEGVELRVAKYEKAIQIAVGLEGGELLASCTLRDPKTMDDLLEKIVERYHGDVDMDDVIAMIKGEAR